jgi:AcrR family transcriptional regulator
MSESTAPHVRRTHAAAALRVRRPRRGRPAQTRERLLAAAAVEFNRVGYHGTDTNRLARAAGYAPATFYKHFTDKRAIFLAAYADWVTAEWTRVEQVLRAGGPPAQLAAAIVDAVLEMHRTWRGLRASLRALVAADADARAFYRAQRRRQLERLAALRARGSAATATDDALLLFTLERVCDAIADGELRDLGVDIDAMVERLRALIIAHVGWRDETGRRNEGK